MDVIGRAAEIVLGLVLLASGALKVSSRAWPAQAAAFGAPPPLARVLPWAEVALGAALAAALATPWTTLAAVALLAAFTVVLAVRVARGRPEPCGCFGELSRRPVDRGTVVRNLVLLGLGAAALL
jgi:uncharacterized membrane protein YphA (DoxX/SURF4 family)